MPQQCAGDTHVQHKSGQHEQGTRQSELVDTQPDQRRNGETTNTAPGYRQTVSQCSSLLKILTNCYDAW